MKEKDIRHIFYNETKEGTIDEQDPTSEFESRDYYVEPIEFEADAGDEVYIEMATQAFNPYLRLIDPRGESVTTDSDYHQGHIHIEATLERTGKYIINATTDNVGETGEYTISLAKIVEDLRSIQYEEIKGGVISEDDPESGFYRNESVSIEPVEFEGRTGDEVTISMGSLGINRPQIRLINPVGESVNVESGNNTCSVSKNLEHDGKYTLNAGTRADRIYSGEYVLRFSESPSARSPTSPTSSPTASTTDTTTISPAETATVSPTNTPTATPSDAPTDSQGAPSTTSSEPTEHQRLTTGRPSTSATNDDGGIPLSALLGGLGIGGVGVWLAQRHLSTSDRNKETAESAVADNGVDMPLSIAEVNSNLQQAEKQFRVANDAYSDERMTVAKTRYRDARDAYQEAIKASQKHQLHELDIQIGNYHFEVVEDIEQRLNDAKDGLESARNPDN